MSSKAPRRIAANLDIIPFAFAPPANLDWVRCANCHKGLELHQPDPQSPTKFLGICDGCGQWFLILINSGLGKAMMVILPEDLEFKAAWDSHQDQH